MNNQILKNHLDKLFSYKIIVDIGNITEASKHVGLTQSTLSHTVKTLEKVLDKKLLIRSKNGVKATTEGELLYKLACSIITQANGIESQISNVSNSLAGNIRIGTHETLASHTWPSFLKNILKGRDEISYSLNTGRVDFIINDILSQNLDLALTVEPLNHTDLVIERVYSGNLKIFTFFDDKKKNISLDELNRSKIFTDIKAHVRQGLGIPQYLGMNSINTNMIIQLSSFEAATNFCGEGLGYCVLPEKNAQHAVKKKQIKEVKVRGIDQRSFGRHSICVSYRKDKNNELINFFVDEIKSFFK